MADGGEKAPAELNPDGTPKKDLRYTTHEERGVRVERELDGSGHLARGDVTKMSVLNFSSRHQVRTERDPDFTFRPAPEPKTAASSPPTESKAPEPAAGGAPEASPPAESSPGLVDRIKGLFGL